LQWLGGSKGWARIHDSSNPGSFVQKVIHELQFIVWFFAGIR